MQQQYGPVPFFGMAEGVAVARDNRQVLTPVAGAC
jgi:hypothetical protein